MPAPSRRIIRAPALGLAAALLATAAPWSPVGIRQVAPARAAITGPYLPMGTEPIAPGVIHEWGSITTTKGNQDIQLVIADPTQPEISFESALSNDRVGGLERTSAMAIRRSTEGHRVVAAINGDVWGGYTNLMTNAPNGIDIEDGELMTADGSNRAAFGYGPDRVPRIGLVREALTVSIVGATLPIPHLNQSPNGGLALFTPSFGPRLSTDLTGVEIVISGLALPLTPSGSWSGIVTDVRPAGGGAPIDPGTVVLIAPAGWLDLPALIPGIQVSLAASITPGWETVTHAVSGREYLVRDGVPYITPRPTSTYQTHPRTAIGLTADGRVVLATVDGRRPDESLGVTLDELAAFLVSKGVVNAINLDGGGSSTMAVRRQGDIDVSVANTPSAGHEIAVTNSIEIVNGAPSGPLAMLTVSPSSATVYERSSVRFSVIAQDAGYAPVPLAPGELVWGVDPALGTIDQAGTLTATAAGSGAVTVQGRGVVGSVPVVVVADTFAPAASAPVSSLPVDETIGSSVPLDVRWSAATDRGTGVASYELELRTDGGAWKTVALPSPTALAVTPSLLRNRTYQFRLRAIDEVGNASAWKNGRSFRLAVAPETTRALRFVRGTWSRSTSVSYDGRQARTTRTTEAVARFTFTGTGFAWVSARSPVRGIAHVSVDGGAPVTVDLYRATSIARQMVLARTWSSSGTHTVVITAVGTAGHPRVDIDAFVVLAPPL